MKKASCSRSNASPSQQISGQLVDGFGPRPATAAEADRHGSPDDLGRCRPSASRDVMQAAAKAARTEMLQRVRENKAGQGGAVVRWRPTSWCGAAAKPAMRLAVVSCPRCGGATPAKAAVVVAAVRVRVRVLVPVVVRALLAHRNPHGTHHGHQASHLPHDERQPRHHGNSHSPTQADAVAHRRAEAAPVPASRVNPIRAHQRRQHGWWPWSSYRRRRWLWRQSLWRWRSIQWWRRWRYGAVAVRRRRWRQRIAVVARTEQRIHPEKRRFGAFSFGLNLAAALVRVRWQSAFRHRQGWLISTCDMRLTPIPPNISGNR